MSSFPAPAPPTLGRYHILKHLASGGMAELYLARATGIEGFERYVVVKKILGDHAKDTRFVKMFLDEARLAAQLHHQNICQVYDCGQDDGTYFFAMEYVHGENARDLLKKVATLRKQIPLEHALTIVAGAAAGLHHAHERRGADRQPLGVVHRDVSPSNLLVAYDGAVKVVDFGIAKAASRMTETRSGTLKGKIAYMSPEQCLGKNVDRRSDVFALGIVLYELTTVTRLFKGENDYITMNRIVTGDILPPSKKRSDYPPALEAIVMKALSLDVADRYQTAADMLEAIERFCASERIALSGIGLGRFVRELFGEKPEPWVDLDGPGEDLGGVEVTQSNVDSGVTGMDPAAMAEIAALPRPVPTTAIAPAPSGPLSSEGSSGPKSASLVLATSASSETSFKPPRRGLAWAIAAVGVAAAVTAGFAIGRQGGGRDASPAGAASAHGAIDPSGTPGPAPDVTSPRQSKIDRPVESLTPVAPTAPGGTGTSSGSASATPAGSGSGSSTASAASDSETPAPPSGKTTTTSSRPRGKISAKPPIAKPPIAKPPIVKTTATTSKPATTAPGSGSGSAPGSGSSAPGRDPTTLFPPQE